MDVTTPCAAAGAIAAQLRAAREELARRWLEGIAERVKHDTERVLAADEFIAHVPPLIDGIAACVDAPAEEIPTDMPLVARATELCELRFAQGFDATELLREYEVLGDMLLSFAAGVAAAGDGAASGDLLVCGQRLFRAVSIIEQVTTARYVDILKERTDEREDRLGRFRKLITHELKNRVGATLGAGELLQEEWLGDEERRRFAGMVTENAQEIQKALENLSALVRLDGEQPRRDQF